ncbi:TonB-dependent receptor [Massilia sp. PWRC2]|uniref:TonB-dependent receptor n=1 Tax=Massilia sp. PWRC2 TaxID=2804626 RepID=UPI003CF645B2
MMETVLSRSLRLMFSSSVAVGLGLASQAALAQEATAPMQRVEITGSAIKRIDAETAVPVTVLKMDDLKKQGVTTIEQVMSNLAISQSQQGTSQVVGLGTGGASFADLRGIGANKTLVLLNGRRLANNAFDSSAPDLNMIPFAALDHVEVLRDGASSLYGSDAVGGVINFITKKDFQGGVATVGYDQPKQAGGVSKSINVAFGKGDLANDGWNIYGIIDHQEQKSINGLQRDYNRRYPGGLSSSTSPANYYQDGASANPLGGNCSSGTNLVAGKGNSCQMTTSSFVDYIPQSDRTTGLLKGTLRLNADHELGFEYMSSESKITSQIAPVPYGGLIQNRTRPDGSLNPYYPGNGNFAPNIPLSPTFDDGLGGSTAQPGFVHVKWRDLENGARADNNINKQQRLITSLEGTLSGWDYKSAFSYNENKVSEYLRGYSDGGIITTGVLNGVINPYGPQSAAGSALIASAALDGNVQNAKGSTTGLDFSASRELGDWLHAGRAAAIAVGTEARHEKFLSAANPEYAAKVVASTGIDPNTRNEGSRSVYAAYTELQVPLLATLDVTGSLRYDKYSDFGSTTNPKLSFLWKPTKALLVRGSFSTGFRAPSLYEIHSAQSYTNSATYDDPVNCPGGKVVGGKSSAANCEQQFQVLTGGNANLNPEKSKNATLGFVIEPINNLTLGADLWAIELKHQISSLSQDDVFADPATYGAIYHRTAAGDLATDGSQCPNPLTCGYVDLRTQNLGGVKTNGVDLSAQYRTRTSAYGAYSFQLNSTYVHKYEYQNSEGGQWHQNVGIYSGTGPIFRWQNTATLNWTLANWGAGLTAHHKTGYSDQDQGDGVERHVASYSTFDTYLSYTMKKGLGITAGLRNLTDRAPPLSLQTQTFQAGYDPRYADVTGRTVYVRASYSF